MKRIAESELIINERGAVYHINLRPDELADTVITVGDPDRVALVSRHFDTIEVQQQHREFVAHTGYIGHKRITVLSTGIGPDNVDIVLNELDALANINFETRLIQSTLKKLSIIRIGTTGSLQANIPVDAMVVSTHAIGLDNLLHYYRMTHTEEELQILQQFMVHTQLGGNIEPYVSSSSPHLLKHFVQNFQHGITVTCPGFYAPQGRVLRLGLSNPQLIDRLTSFSFGNHRISNFEMETSAMYGLAKLMGHQCLSLSTVVANRVTQTFTKDGNAAIATLIENALAIIGGY